MGNQAPSRLRRIVAAPFVWLGNALPVSGSILLLVLAGSAIGPRPHVMAEELAAYGFIGHLLWAAGLGVAAFVRIGRRPLWQLLPVLPVVLAFGALSALPVFLTGFCLVILGVGLAGPVTFPVDLTLPCLGVLTVASISGCGLAGREVALGRRVWRRRYQLVLGAIILVLCVRIGISERHRAAFDARLTTTTDECLLEYTRGLSSTVPRTRAWAARGMAMLGPFAAPAIPALTAAIEDPWFPARVEAITALGEIGPAAESAIPAMIEAVRQAPPPFFNDTPSEREMLQKPLVKAALRIAPGRLAELAAAYPDQERYWMVNNMGMYLSREAPVAIPALCRILEGPDPSIRPGAAYALYCLLPHHRSPVAVDPLLRAAADPHLRGWAVRALGRTRDPRARPLVRSLLGHPDEDTRYSAAEALGALFAGAPADPELDDAVDRLARMAEKETRTVRIAALNGLATIGRAAHPAIPTLKRIAASGDKDLAWYASYALDRVALER